LRKNLRGSHNPLSFLRPARAERARRETRAKTGIGISTMGLKKSVGYGAFALAWNLYSTPFYFFKI